MKTKILFVIESLICGGAEKSLTTLLNLIDYNRFEVYLQLFTFKGEFMRYIPKEVNLLPLLPSTQIEGMSIMSQLLSGKFGAMVAHIKFSYKVRRIKNSNSNDIFTYAIFIGSISINLKNLICYFFTKSHIRKN